jgi:hypothetical protein
LTPFFQGYVSAKRQILPGERKDPSDQLQIVLIIAGPIPVSNTNLCVQVLDNFKTRANRSIENPSGLNTVLSNVED